MHHLLTCVILEMASADTEVGGPFFRSLLRLRRGPWPRAAWGLQMLNEDTGETLVKDTVSGAQPGIAGKGCHKQPSGWAKQRYSKGQKEGDIKRKGEGERDDKSTKHWYMLDQSYRQMGKLLLIALMASGRLGLMGGLVGVRQRESHGRGQTATRPDIGHQYAKAHHLHQASTLGCSFIKINNSTN